MSEKRPKTRNGHAIRIPPIVMPEASKAEASSKAESPEELKPDNKK